MPARQYTQKDGTTAYQRLVDFASPETHAKFQRLAKDAVDRHFAEHAADGTNDKEAAASQKRCDDAKTRVQQAARDHDRAVIGAGRKY